MKNVTREIKKKVTNQILTNLKKKKNWEKYKDFNCNLCVDEST